jgi:rubrerythrin
MANESKDRQQTIGVVKRNWQAEVETAQTYRDLAEREQDEKRKRVLLRMAEAEERHAQRWEKKLRDLGVEPPVPKDTIRRRLSVGGTRLPEPRSPFAEWKRRKNDRKPNFTNKPNAPSRVNRMCRNFCGRARLRKKRMHERLVPWRRRLVRAPRWTES